MELVTCQLHSECTIINPNLCMCTWFEHNHNVELSFDHIRLCVIYYSHQALKVYMNVIC